VAGFRWELSALAVVSGSWWLTANAIGIEAGGVVVGVATVGLVAWPASRSWAWQKLRHGRVRRSFLAAVRATRFDPAAGRLPTVLRAADTPAGYRLRVRVPRGLSVSSLEAVAEVCAAAMQVSDVRVARDRDNAARAEVTIVVRDPLATTMSLDWPLADTHQCNLWEPIPVAIDEDGGPVAINLPEHNLLLGGEPGAGKSAVLSLLVSAAALDPTVKLWLLDGKQVELAPWSGCAEALVGPNLEDAIRVLERLQTEMDMRYAQLLAWRRRKVSPGDGLGLHVVACDELALFLATGERDQRSRCADLLRDLVARGRAAGIIVLAATQKPSSDVIPTSLRDIFGYRWALRCATRDASDTILGAGWATQGYSAAEIDPAARGVGYLLHEGGVPVRLRAAYLDDDTLAALADRATALRATGSVP
jgi:DNA segregation ATPase FtsK/SpoIIIE-like protein